MLYLHSGTLLRPSYRASKDPHICCSVFMTFGRRHAIPQMAMGFGGLGSIDLSCSMTIRGMVTIRCRVTVADISVGDRITMCKLII